MRSGHEGFSPSGNPYYEELCSEITDLDFVQRTFAFGPGLVSKEGSITKYYGQPFDHSELRLDREAWTHDHCYICNFTINVGHTYWENKRDDCLCDICHEYALGR